MTAYDAHEVVKYAYLPLFAGRADAYAAWNGTSWQAIREPLTPAVVVDAWQARRPLSFYLLGPDSCGHVAAVDFDGDDGLDLAIRLGEAMAADGAPAYVEPSRRGAHLWAILDDRLPAIVLRRALRAFLQAAGIPDDPKVELRPGSDRLSGPDALGHCLRGPLQPHPETGKRALLLDPRARQPIGRSVAETCLAVEQVPGDVFLNAAERYRPPEAPRESTRARSGPVAAFLDRVTVTAVLARDYGLQALPGRTVKCPRHEDRRPSLSIARDDRRAWCHAPACELSGDGRGLDAFELARLARRVAA
jgi:hypothetical protein